MPCPFCKIENERIVASSELVFCIRDIYPVTRGHSLIITRRHVASFFDLTEDERKAIDRMIFETRTNLDKELQPDGYNIGVNIGCVSGQTIDHVHIHLIPRYSGDMKNPKGGVRGVIPEKQGY